MVFRFGLSNLPLEPPDNPSALLTEEPDDLDTLFSPNGFTSIGMQRAAQAQVVPARFGVRVRPGLAPLGPFPNRGGLAPGGGQLPDIPIPEAWKILGPTILGATQLLPSTLESRARGTRKSKNNVCHDRFAEEEAECRRNSVDPAHADFLRGCITRAEERRSKCIQNGGRPHPDETPKWRAGSDKKPGDEEVWKKSRSLVSNRRVDRFARPGRL